MSSSAALREALGRQEMHTNMQRLLHRIVAGLTTIRQRSEGQALIEYALIVSLIALVAIAALQLTGVHLKSLLTTIAGEV